MKNIAIMTILLLPLILLAGISVTSQLTQHYYTEAGKTIKGNIEIINTSSEPTRVSVYLKDYLFFSDGSNSYEDPGSIERSNANWISIDPEQATIDGGSNLRIDYVINIPNEVNLDGSYWSLMMIEEAPGDPGELAEDEFGVVMNMRYGVQIITDFGTKQEPQIEFVNTQLIDEEGKKELLLDLENNGKIMTRSKLKIEVYDMEGNFIDLFEGEGKRTYPGTSVRLRCDISKLDKGSYKAIVMADCGEEYIFGTNVTLEF